MIDPKVWQHATRILRDDAVIDQEIDRVYGADPVSYAAAAVARSLAEVERQRQRVARQIAALDSDDADVLVRELKTLGERKRGLEAEQAAVATRQAGREAARAQLLATRDMLHSLVGDEIDRLDYAERRLALEALGIEVRIYRQGHSPRWEVFCAKQTVATCD